VAIGARREDRLASLAERIEGDGGRAVALPVDVADEDSARSFVTEAHSQLGGLDILVNNAGVMLLGPVEGAPTEQWRTMVNVNLLGLLYCTHAALPLMREAGRGHIVNLSSVAGRSANAGSAVYNLTKFGVGAFSESLRQEVAERNIRVTLVEPGAVTTELRTHLRPEIAAAQTKRFEGVTPLEATDIANAIIYAIGQPEHVSLNEILVRPTRQLR
jgi:NADP-dependent 3-hydroxy acid dehydrogenase YdfG